MVEIYVFSLIREYMQRRRRFRKGGSNSALSILRRELREGKFQSFLGGSLSLVSSSNTEPDPWLSSFIFNPPVDDEPTSAKLHSSNETSAAMESSVHDLSERYWHCYKLFSTILWVHVSWCLKWMRKTGEVFNEGEALQWKRILRS